MAIRDGFVDWAVRIDGPADKVYSEPNKQLGIVCHSIEGNMGASDRLGRVFDVSRNADGSYTDAAAMSCMFVLRKVGRLVQYYPVTASPWCSGNRTANTGLWSVEVEGRAGEPWTAAQVATMLRLADEWEAYTGKKLSRADGSPLRTIGTANAFIPTGRTLFRHKEVAMWDIRNAGPTACDSDRSAAFFAAVAAKPKGDDMTADEVKRVVSEAIQPLVDRVNELNTAAMMRFEITSLASGDYETMRRAYRALQDGGFIRKAV
jgi:hypothetical protein